MSLPRRIFYNTLVQTAGKIFSLIIGILTISLLSRYLEEQGFGQYSTVIAFMGMFAIFADFGLYLYVVREISKPATNHHEILGNALGLRLTAAAALLVLGASIAWLLPYDPIVKKTMFVAIAAFLFAALNQVLVGVFQKHLVQHLLVISETAGRAINLLLVYFFVRESFSLPYFVLAMALANAATFSLTLIFAKRYEKFQIAFDTKIWRQILRVSWPLVFGIILNLIYFKADTIILSVLKSEQEVGIYSLPYKILETLIVFPGMFIGLIMPLLSKTAFTDWAKFREILQRSFDALLLISLLVIVSTSFFAENIIDLIRGHQDFADSPALLQILILSAGTVFLGTLFGYAVVAVNKQKAMVKGYLLGAILGLILYLALIPRYSYWGAAWGTLATELIVATYAFFLVKKASSQKVSFKILIPAFPALLILVLFFHFASLPWMLEMGIGVLLYASALLLFRAIPLDLAREIMFLK